MSEFERNNYNNENEWFRQEPAPNVHPSDSFASSEGQTSSEIYQQQETAAPQEEVKIRLDGQETGSAAQNGVENEKIPALVKQKPFHEHVHKKSNAKRYIAAGVAVAVLNLAILGGAVGVGYSFGKNSGSSASQLAAALKDEGGSTAEADNGATTLATGEGELSTTEIAQKVGPAIVGITTQVVGQLSIFGTQTVSQAEGSGIIISSDGYIVTNNHVIEGGSQITVLLNTGTEYQATVIGTDSQTDLAVIKIEPTETLTVAELGDSNEVQVGERAIAIGNPMGLEFFGSVTQGIVSAVNRTITVDDNGTRTMNVIQTDAAINEGNSGGALINSRGQVIGINSVKLASSGVEGMGFAIPISDAKTVISDLLEYGYVKGRPVLGITARDVNDYMAQAYHWPKGVQVMGVTPGSGAEAAGLEQGDIITKADGQVVENNDQLDEIKKQHSPGDTLQCEVYKYSTGLTQTVNITLSEELPASATN